MKKIINQSTIITVNASGEYSLNNLSEQDLKVVLQALQSTYKGRVLYARIKAEYFGHT